MCTTIFTLADLKEKKPDFFTLSFAFSLKTKVPKELV